MSLPIDSTNPFQTGASQAQSVSSSPGSSSGSSSVGYPRTIAMTVSSSPLSNQAYNTIAVLQGVVAQLQQLSAQGGNLGLGSSTVNSEESLPPAP